MTADIAVYTANHGLAWTFDPARFSQNEADLCRTAFGPLPDFEYGEAGFEGILKTEAAIFVVRCFPASKWDFRGRDATYLVVAKLPHNAHASVRSLLSSPTFTYPQRIPCLTLEIPSENGDLSEFTPGVYRREIGAAQFIRIEIQRKKDTMSPADELLKAPVVPQTDEKSQPAGNTNPSSGPQRKSSQGTRVVLGLLTCFAIFVGLSLLGVAVFGWKHGGGVIPMVIMFGLMALAWHAITGCKE